MSLQPCGTRAAYKRGCRCPRCVDAMRAAWRGYWKPRSPRIVSATPARRLLRRWQRQGIGLPTIAASTGLSCCTLFTVRSGRAERIHLATEARIRAFVPAHLPDGVRTDSSAMLDLLREGRAEGYTLRRIARAAGCPERSLSAVFRRDRMTARLARQITAGLRSLGVW